MKLISIDLRFLPTFYQASNLYLQFIEDLDNVLSLPGDDGESDGNYRIHLPQDKYWEIIGEENQECNLAKNRDEMIRLLVVCDYWMFKELPWLIMKSFSELNNQIKAEIFELLKEEYFMGKEYQEETLLKLNCFSEEPELRKLGYFNICANCCMEMLIFTVENEICEQNDFEMLDDDGYNPMMRACENGHKEVVEYMLENNNCPSIDLWAVNNLGNNSLMIACSQRHKDIVVFLIENTSFPFHDFEITNNYDYDVFTIACISGDISIVQYLLENEVYSICDLEEDDEETVKLKGLEHACSFGRLNIVKYLLENKRSPLTSIKSVDEDGASEEFSRAFHNSCKVGELELIKYFVENEICPYRDIGAEDEFGNNALMIACKYGQLEVVKYIIENDNCPFVDIRLENEDGENAFLLACQEGFIEIVMYLLSLLGQVHPQETQEMISIALNDDDVLDNEAIVTFLLRNI